MKIPRWFWQFRGYFLAIPLIFATFWFHFEIEYDIVVWPAGIAVFLLGVTIRIWALQHLHFSVRQTRPRVLVRTGPYRFVRNPLYVGNILIGVGATIVSELLWLVPVTLAWWFFIYSFVVRYEEEHLIEQHGDEYKKYMAEVPRWFPNTISLKKLGFVNRFLFMSALAELRSAMILAPFIVKELTEPLFV